MLAWEITAVDRSGVEKRVHVIATDGGHALIEFRNEYSLDDWRVDALNQLVEQQVIEHPTLDICS